MNQCVHVRKNNFNWMLKFERTEDEESFRAQHLEQSGLKPLQNLASFNLFSAVGFTLFHWYFLYSSDVLLIHIILACWNFIIVIWLLLSSKQKFKIRYHISVRACMIFMPTVFLQVCGILYSIHLKFPIWLTLSVFRTVVFLPSLITFAAMRIPFMTVMVCYGLVALFLPAFFISFPLAFHVSLTLKVHISYNIFLDGVIAITLYYAIYRYHLQNFVCSNFAQCAVCSQKMLTDSKATSAIIKEKHQRRKQLLIFGQLAHDIGTPLTAISLAFDTLELHLKKENGSYMDSKERETAFKTIRSSLDSINDLRRSILDQAKAVCPLTPSLTEVDLVHLVRQRTLPILKSLLVSKKGKVYPRFEIEKIFFTRMVLTDPKWVQDMLLNFLSNAVKFTELGSITIAVELREKKKLNNDENNFPMVPERTSESDETKGGYSTIFRGNEENLEAKHEIFNDESIGESPTISRKGGELKKCKRWRGLLSKNIFSLQWYKVNARIAVGSPSSKPRRYSSEVNDIMSLEDFKQEHSFIEAEQTNMTRRRYCVSASTQGSGDRSRVGSYEFDESGNSVLCERITSANPNEWPNACGGSGSKGFSGSSSVFESKGREEICGESSSDADLHEAPCCIIQTMSVSFTKSMSNSSLTTGKPSSPNLSLIRNRRTDSQESWKQSIRQKSLSRRFTCGNPNKGSNFVPKVSSPSVNLASENFYQTWSQFQQLSNDDSSLNNLNSESSTWDLGNTINAYTLTDSKRLCLEQGDVEVVISVTDTGCGIPPQKMAQLFKPYSQLQNDKGGTGLGLVSVKEKAQILGGNAGVIQSDRSQGSTFWFSIPFTQVATGESSTNLIQSRSDASKIDEHLTVTLKKQMNLLVMAIDDSSVLLKMYGKIFRDIGIRDENIMLMASGDEGLQSLQTPHQPCPDAIFIDDQMPGLSGPDLVRALAQVANAKQSGYRPSIFVVTGCHPDEIKKKYASVNQLINDVLTKPLGKKQFEELIWTDVLESVSC
mmetsp:Transcript_13618/g.17755  ORF Transcript_13618/g.17755 Transcript_13618/m.17755 type:complete len:999 (+) Transcript_13618:247-3243(+)